MAISDINKNFLDLIADAKKNPKKYREIKNCKNLSEIYSFIKKIHPEYSFTEKELEKLILGLAKIPDDALNVSGGLISTVGHYAKIGSELTNLITDMIFSEEEMNPLEMSDKMIKIMQNTKSGEVFKSEHMKRIEKNSKTIDKIKPGQISRLNKIDSHALKTPDKLNNLSQLPSHTTLWGKNKD